MADVTKKQRGGVRSTLTADFNKITPMLRGAVATEHAVLRATYKRLEHNLNRVYKMDEAIQQQLEGNAVDQDIAEALKYNDVILSTMVAIEEMLPTLTTSANETASSQRSGQNSNATIKLPKFEMKAFGGDPLEWQHFWDLYKTAIHNNASITSIEKFSYLIGYLKDDALAVAKGYDLTESNYNQVIEALTERFGDKQRAQFAHFQALIAIDKAKSNTLTEVQRVYDQCEMHIRSLVALELDESTFAVVFVPIILSKLPMYLSTKLCEKNGLQQWRLQNLRDWLKVDLRAREMGKSATNGGTNPHVGGRTDTAYNYKRNATTSSLAVPQGQTQRFRNPTASPTQRLVAPCIYCAKTGHRHSDCRSFSTTDTRLSVLSQLPSRVCRVCLRSAQHRREDCPFRTRPCFFCKKPGHHPSLCYEKFGVPAAFQGQQPSLSGGGYSAPPQSTHKAAATGSSETTGAGALFTPRRTNATVTVCPAECNDTVADVTYLKTALVKVTNEMDERTSFRARCLLDDASSRTYITEACCRKLGLDKVGPAHVAVGRFGTGRRSTQKSRRVQFNVTCDDGSSQPVLAIVTRDISAPVSRYPIDLSRFPFVKKLRMAEPIRSTPDELELDILVGTDQYYNFVSLTGGFARDGLVFVPSRLGYLTSGFMTVEPEHRRTVESTMVMLNHGLDLEPPIGGCDIERFWQIEDIGVHEAKSSSGAADDEALRQFQETVQFHDGRYHVAWPWKTKNPDLPDNFGLAYGRLRSTYARLKSMDGGHLLTEYDKVIQQQFDKGVIEPAPGKPDGLVHYLPHHPVVTPAKTTKVRIVYDASSKAKKDLLSLNDCLLRGSVILDDLCGLLLRFRMNQVALTSDIEKAFLQVRLQSQERDVGRFLWVHDTSKPPQGSNLAFWRFTSVFFGAISSPFLLGATIDTHLRRADGAVATKIRENLYVDNVVTGEENDNDAINHYRQAKSLLSGASMNLREFYTNSSVVRDSFAPQDKGKSKEPKVLGIRWKWDPDTLNCCGITLGEEAPVTKRSIVRKVAQVYDPCGWISPVVTPAKCLVQTLWKRNLSWDEQVPDDVQKEWMDIRNELSAISDIPIPRYIGAQDEQIRFVELHVFCDASTRAAAAAAYVRIEKHDGVSCNLVFSKTRLAPLKPPQTVPRLELIALVLGANVLEFVERQLRMAIHGRVLWSDSQCVLCWLKKEKLTTKFVERRIDVLRQKTDVDFRYVPSEDNPADLPTRGSSVSSLQSNRLWWNGPSWLAEGREEWPKDRTATIQPVSDAPRDVQLVAVEGARVIALLDCQKFSSFTRLLRTTAYVQRFISNARKPKAERQVGRLTVAEMSAARRYWERLAQNQGYPLLRGHLTTGQLRRSSVAQLNVYRDQEGRLRCRSRLSNADVLDDVRNPVLLPKHHPFTALVLRHTHVATGHAGVAQCLQAVRQHYWIPSGRKQIKSVIRDCRRCRRIDGGAYEIPQPPQLPNFRVTEQPPFAATGLDYLGFLTVKTGPGEYKKVWVCLFTCAVTRAIHLELVENQSAEEFHLALRRFFAIYGCPRLIVSDNASQLLAVEATMKKLWSTLTSNEAEMDPIEWKKLPQLAPWMGGFFERLVGIVKKFLKRTIDGVCVTLNELRTILAEVTAMVNSRPLLYVEDDIWSRPLSPSDLIGQHGKRMLPAFDDVDVPTTRSTVDSVTARWKRLQNVTTLFWNDWKQGYLTSLREKHANATQRNPSCLKPTVGSVVQIKDKLPRGQWRLGKIEKLIPSADGNVRSVALRLASGRTLIRPIKLLYPLEMQTVMQTNYVEEVVQGHPLSLNMTYINVDGSGLRFNGVPISSLGMAIAYFRLSLAGKPADIQVMLSDQRYLWQPHNGALDHFVERSLSGTRPNIQFELRLDRVLQSIIEEQLKDRDNHLGKYLRDVLRRANGRDVLFKVYGSDPVLTVGHKPSAEVPSHLGYNVLGEVLSDVLRRMRDGILMRFELPELMYSNAFDSSFRRYALFLSDSQCRHLHNVNTAWGSQVVAVSGAKYGDIANVLRSDIYNLNEYGLIVVQCGTNCFNRSYVTSGQRDAELRDLCDILRRVATDRPRMSMLFSCAFAHPYIPKVNARHMDDIERSLSGAGIACLNWNRVQQPFIDERGLPILQYFDDRAADPGHLSAQGTQLLYDYWCIALPKLRFVPYRIGEERITILKSEFAQFGPPTNPSASAYHRDRSRSPIVDPKAVSRIGPCGSAGPSDRAGGRMPTSSRSCSRSSGYERRHESRSEHNDSRSRSRGNHDHLSRMSTPVNRGQRSVEAEADFSPKKSVKSEVCEVKQSKSRLETGRNDERVVVDTASTEDEDSIPSESDMIVFDEHNSSASTSRDSEVDEAEGNSRKKKDRQKFKYERDEA